MVQLGLTVLHATSCWLLVALEIDPSHHPRFATIATFVTTWHGSEPLRFKLVDRYHCSSVGYVYL